MYASVLVMLIVIIIGAAASVSPEKSVHVSNASYTGITPAPTPNKAVIAEKQAKQKQKEKIEEKQFEKAEQNAEIIVKTAFLIPKALINLFSEAE